jgi:hypothetical protein
MKLSALLAVLTLGFLLKGTDMAAAQNFQWQANAYNDAGNGGKNTAYLTQGVPETDNIAFRAACQAGSSARFAPAVFVYNTRNLPRNAQLTVSFFVDGRQVRTMQGLVHVPQSEEGIYGIFLRVDIDDPLWEILAANRYVRYEANGMGKAGMNLSGSRQAIERFLGDCRGIFGMRQAQPPQQVNQGQPAQPSTPGGRPPQGYPSRQMVRYNCQNGPQLTVIYRGDALRYVYDGPDSAMRTMRAYRGNRRHFKDGPNSITLEPNRSLVDYREGNDLYDRCRAF